MEISEVNPEWQNNEDGFKNIVIEILETNYLNRIKQFILRLHRNNLLQ